MCGCESNDEVNGAQPDELPHEVEEDQGGEAPCYAHLLDDRY